MPNVAFWDVNTQQDFVLPEGKLYVKGAEKLRPNFRKLYAFARKARVYVVATADDGGAAIQQTTGTFGAVSEAVGGKGGKGGIGKKVILTGSGGAGGTTASTGVGWGRDAGIHSDSSGACGQPRNDASRSNTRRPGVS